MSNLFDDNEFDRHFNRVGRMAVIGFIVSTIATLAFAGVVVWAIIKTVTHFFG